MRNKFQLIDINIVSAYLGRWMTAIAAIVVLMIATAAVFWGGDMREHTMLYVGVPLEGNERDTRVAYESLRARLAEETGRETRVVVYGDEFPVDCELTVVRASAMSAAREHGLNAAYELTRSPRRTAALLVTAAGRVVPQIEDIGADEVVFSDPHSLNGFWVQYLALFGEGGVKSSALNFTGRNGRRAVLDVVYGRYRVAACTSADVDALVHGGEVSRDELKIVHTMPAVPELVVALKDGDADYYASVFNRLEGAFTDSERREQSSADARPLPGGFNGLRKIGDDDRARIKTVVGRASLGLQ